LNFDFNKLFKYPAHFNKLLKRLKQLNEGDMIPAPIALFVYNRPWHTKRTVEALQRNLLANESELFIFGEEPCDKCSEQVEILRAYIKTVDGFRKVTIIEREKNFGLDRAVIAGVTDLINQYGQVIVLEDDVTTSPYFLKYMNDALERYRDIPEVMHVGGYMFPIDAECLPETFFFRCSHSWGWGTWKRAWDQLNPDLRQSLPVLDWDSVYRFNIDGTYDYWRMLIEQRKRSGHNTWDILWYLTVFLQDGKCLFPSISLTNNIGHDGSGSHMVNTDCFEVTISNKEILFFEKNIKENSNATEAIKRFLAGFQPPLYKRYFLNIIDFIETQRLKMFSRI